jgi:hypothetical protein
MAFATDYTFCRHFGFNFKEETSNVLPLEYVVCLKRFVNGKHIIEGKREGRVEVMGRRGRRRKQVLDDLREMRRYFKLKMKHWIALCG